MVPDCVVTADVRSLVCDVVIYMVPDCVVTVDMMSLVGDVVIYMVPDRCLRFVAEFL